MPLILPRRCEGGQCKGRRKECKDSDCRRAGTCNPADGQCSPGAPKHEGRECTRSNDKCITGARCTAGECIGGTPKTCPVEQCRTQACNPQSGQCKGVKAPEGTACTLNGQAGTCAKNVSARRVYGLVAGRRWPACSWLRPRRSHAIHASPQGKCKVGKRLRLFR